MNGARKDRVGAKIHHELTTLLQSGLHDPRLGFTTVTGVDLTRDMRHARVFVSILGDDATREKGMQALTSASGYLRRELAHRLNMRRTPDLEFILDLTGDRGERIDRLLQEAGLGGGMVDRGLAEGVGDDETGHDDEAGSDDEGGA